MIAANDTLDAGQLKVLSMAFGPWTTNDPKIQRTVVRTNASSGALRKRFTASYPPPATVAQTKTAITGGFEFAINVVNSSNVAGYNVYSSLTNNSNIAKRIKFVPQPRVNATLQTEKIQDITALNPFYWVAATNGAGKESIRVPIAGVAAPTPAPTNSAPAVGSSGAGSAGGRGGKVPGGRFVRE